MQLRLDKRANESPEIRERERKMLIYYKYAYTGENAGWLGEIYGNLFVSTCENYRLSSEIFHGEETRQVRPATSSDIFR